MLIEKIKQDQLQARKERNVVKATFLGTLYSEAYNVGKNENRDSTDNEVLAVIKKFLKNVNENIKFCIERQGTHEVGSLTYQLLGSNINTLTQEKQILESYQPKQLDQAELTSIINQIIEDLSVGGDIKIGQVLQKLKLNFEGQYDGALASKITKESLG